MEVEAAYRRHLKADATVNGYVAGKVYKFRLEEKVDGTGGAAVVVHRNNGWATPDPVNSQEFPILSVKCYADPSRSSDGEITRLDAEERAFALYRAVDMRMLQVRRGIRIGGVDDTPGLMVVTSQRWKEPTLQTEKDRHGQTAGDPLGDSVYVYVEYALQVIH